MTDEAATKRPPTVAVIGASTEPGKYGNVSVRAHLQHGYRVFPVNPNATEVEGIRAYASVLDIDEPLDRVTLYLPPERGLELLPEIAVKKPKEFYVNPGAESPELIQAAKALGLEPILACSIIEARMRARDRRGK